MACSSINRNTSCCLINNCLKDLSVSIIIKCIELTSCSKWEQTVYSVVDQMIYHLS